MLYGLNVINSEREALGSNPASYQPLKKLSLSQVGCQLG
jgi:hypothetical protein